MQVWRAAAPHCPAPHAAHTAHMMLSLWTSPTCPHRSLATSWIFASSVGLSAGQTCLHVVRSIREQRRSVTVLLAGTSGTGKSTLAGLLAARLGISTVLSTDSVRHMLRSFTPQAANPLLWASTYEVRASAPPPGLIFLMAPRPCQSKPPTCETDALSAGAGCD